MWGDWCVNIVNIIVVTILKYICVSYDHIVHRKLTQCYMSTGGNENALIYFKKKESSFFFFLPFLHK